MSAILAVRTDRVQAAHPLSTRRSGQASRRRCAPPQDERFGQVISQSIQIASVSAILSVQENRTGNVAQHVLGRTAEHHLDDAAVAVSADEQQIVTLFADE